MSGRGGTRTQTVYDLAYGLIGVLPYGLAVAALTVTGLDVADGLAPIAAVALVSQLTGVRLLRRNADQLGALAEQLHAAGRRPGAGEIGAPRRAARELRQIAAAFGELLGAHRSLDRRYRDLTAKLMVYARDVERYQQRLAREALIRQRLGRYVGAEVVARIQRSGGELPLAETTREITVLFADIRSFTRLSEQLPPIDVLRLLNDYFDRMVEEVFAHQGVLDKFVGDELMALFGVLRDPERAAGDAIRAALAMQRRVAGLMAERRRAGKPEFAVGIGINTGTVVIGNVGSRNRMDYTVIGDAVNVAARLEQMAAGGTVLVGEATRRQAPPGLELLERGAIEVRNRREPVRCWEVRGG